MLIVSKYNTLFFKEITCISNCKSLVTPSSVMSVRVSFRRDSPMQSFYNTKTYNWELKEYIEGEYVDVVDFTNMTLAGEYDMYYYTFIWKEHTQKVH